MKSLLEPYKRFFVIFAMLEALVILSFFSDLIAVIIMITYFPSYVVGLLICCGDYMPREVLFIVLLFSNAIYAIIINKLINIFKKT